MLTDYRKLAFNVPNVSIVFTHCAKRARRSPKFVRWNTRFVLDLISLTINSGFYFRLQEKKLSTRVMMLRGMADTVESATRVAAERQLTVHFHVQCNHFENNVELFLWTGQR
jgi:hypothetical protein